MGKNLVAQEQPLAKIFSDDYVFTIPGYQRPYAWTTEQARELCDDLIGAMGANGGAVVDMPPYFLGSIVLIKKDDAPDADVVDGQQRLTTLTILLAAIRSLVDPKHASEITQLIYERGSTILSTKDRFRLKLRPRDADFFQDYVQREEGFQKLIDLAEQQPDSRRNIRANACLFRERLARMPTADIVRLAQFIVTRCYLVVVSTPDMDSAYRIFSVMNSRGLDLSATDILKAEIVGSAPATVRDAYTKKWEDIEEDLGREAFGDLFSHIRMIYRKSKPMGTLLKEFKEHVTEAQQPTRFIDELLQPMARAYGEIKDGAFETTTLADEINGHLKWLNRLEFTDWIPPSIAFAVRHRQRPDKLEAYFRELERISYAMLIMKAGVNDRIERYSSLTKRIEAGQDIWAADSPIQLSAQEQRQVYEMLDGPLYESLAARARTAVLLRLDTMLSGGGATYDYSIISVEHVLPQNPVPGSLWTSWIPESVERARWVHRIGNLALLSKSKNSAASNYEFDIKKKAYFSKNGTSPFVLTTQVLGYNEWTLTVMQQRQKELMAALESVWRLEGREK